MDQELCSNYVGGGYVAGQMQPQGSTNLLAEQTEFGNDVRRGETLFEAPLSMRLRG